MKEGWIVGSGLVPRTGKTSLTDDELVVCDVIFDAPTSKSFLLTDDFGLAFNLPYGAFEVLRPAILERMQALGIVEASEDEEPSVRLTAVGAAMWERERRPVWGAYCSESRRTVGTDRVLEIRALEQQVAEAFWRTGGACGMWRTEGAVTTIDVARAARFPYWRTADLVTLRCPSTANDDGVRDWSAYEKRRTWWRTVPELLRSHRVLDPMPEGIWPPSLQQD